MAEPNTAPLNPPTDQELQSLWLRAWIKGWRAFNNGVGQFVLAVLVLMAAMLAGRVWWDLSSQRHRVFTERIGEMILAERQGPRTERLGFDSMVLDHVNTAQELSRLDCPPSDPDCQTMFEMHRVFLGLADTVLSSSGCSTVNTAFWTRLKRSHPHATRLFRRICRAKERWGDPLLLDDCDMPKDYRAVPRIRHYGGVRCRMRMAHTETSLLVPSSLNTYLKEHGPGLVEYPPRIQRAIRVSDLVDEMLAITLPGAPIRQSIEVDDWRIVQAYFISVDSVLRIWAHTPLDAERQFAPNERWTQATYFRKLELSDENTLTTPAYIDSADQGIVRSHCSAVEVPANGNQQRVELMGVFCTDFAVPENRVAAAVARSPFFQVAHIKYCPKEPERVEVQFIDHGRSMDVRQNSEDTRATSTISRDNDDPRAAPASKAIASWVRAYSDQPTGKPKIHALTVDGVKAYFVPLANHGTDLRTGMLLFSSLGKVARAERLSGLLCLALLAMTAVAAGFSWMLRRRISESSHRLELLRNLQVGVLQLNEDAEIEFANDRAEEMLGVELSKTMSQTRPTSLGALIEDEIVVDEESSWRMADLTYIREQRRAGMPSSYFVRPRVHHSWLQRALKAQQHDDRPPSAMRTESCRWLRISGTPVLAHEWSWMTRRATNAPKALAIIELVAPAVEADLDIEWSRSRSGTADGDRR